MEEQIWFVILSISFLKKNPSNEEEAAEYNNELITFIDDMIQET